MFCNRFLVNRFLVLYLLQVRNCISVTMKSCIVLTLYIFGFHSSIHQVQSQINSANNIEILFYSDQVEYICQVEYTNQIAWSLETSEVVISFLFFPEFHSQGSTQVDIL